MKRCSACRTPQPLGSFNRCSSSVDGLQAYCRDCQRAYHARHRSRLNPMIHARTRARREVLAVRVIEVLRASACADCGETDPLVLEFDHVGDDKEADVSRLVIDGVSWARVAAEIAKCDVVCANCHRRRTARRGGHLRWRVLESVGRPGFEPGTTTA